MNKTKVVLISTALVMLVIMCVSGTLAWFTASDTEINQLNYQNVDVEVYEDNGNMYNVYPGAEVHKNPLITNTSNSTDPIYVRVAYHYEDAVRTTYTRTLEYDTITIYYVDENNVEHTAICTPNGVLLDGSTVAISYTTANLPTDLGTSWNSVMDYYIANLKDRTDTPYGHSCTYHYEYSQTGVTEALTSAQLALIDSCVVDAIETTGGGLHVVNDATELAAIVSGTTTITERWVKYGDFYYYNGRLPAGEGEYFFESITFPAEDFGNDYQNASLELHITAQAMQVEGFVDAENVGELITAWTTTVSGNLDYATGYATTAVNPSIAVGAGDDAVEPTISYGWPQNP